MAAPFAIGFADLQDFPEFAAHGAALAAAAGDGDGGGRGGCHLNLP